MDIETYIVDLIVRVLDLDPRVGSEARLELALRYLEEGRALLDRDLVQASEKLYKAVEEVVKALAEHFTRGGTRDRREEGQVDGCGAREGR